MDKRFSPTVTALIMSVIMSSKYEKQISLTHDYWDFNQTNRIKVQRTYLEHRCMTFTLTVSVIINGVEKTLSNITHTDFECQCNAVGISIDAATDVVANYRKLRREIKCEMRTDRLKAKVSK